MADSFLDIHDVHVYRVSTVGPELRSDKDAVDVMSAAAEQRADWIVIPVDRLGDDFFELRTRIAGEMLQKFTMYGKRIVILGDISRRTAASRSLAAFVAESNRGPSIWFLPALTDFENRLSRNPAETS